MRTRAGRGGGGGARRYIEGRPCHVLWSVGVRQGAELQALLPRLQAAGFPTRDISAIPAVQARAPAVRPGGTRMVCTCQSARTQALRLQLMQLTTERMQWTTSPACVFMRLACACRCLCRARRAPARERPARSQQDVTASLRSAVQVASADAKTCLLSRPQP